MRQSSLLLVLAAAAAATASLAASGPTFWTVATAADFLKGTSDGVFVSLSGTLTPGPALTNRLTSTPPQIWSLSEAPDGTLWAGTGAEGRLIRLRAGQAEETAFDSQEANIFAVATAGTRVYAASSPDGKVYAIDGTQAARVFFDPTETYIWALAVDRGGNLWVGAGNPAVIYRVAADGSSQVVYRPPAAHVVSLAIDANGRVLAGTESPGRLYRFDDQNRPFVLLDSGLVELRAIAPDGNGGVFAAAIAKGDETSEASEPASVAVTLAKAPAPGSDAAANAPARRSVIYRVDPSGSWEQIWATADLAYDLNAEADGGVLVATGPEGRLYKIARDRDVSLLTGVDAHQITRFAHSRTGALSAFATANPGRVVSVGAGTQAPASFVSAVQDTSSVSTWGLIRWESTGPVALYSRSGNTARPDDSWSAWTGPYTNRDGTAVTSPPARFVQWRAVFADPAVAASSPSAATPSQLTGVTMAYLTRNSRPSVTSVTVHPPGVVFQRPYVNDETAVAGMDEATAEARRAPGDRGPAAPAPGRRMFQKGLQTIGWKAEDADDDRLEYSLQYRRDGESEWHDLRARLSTDIFVWDTTTVADGRYVVRVQASDRADNIGARALTGDMVSGAIDVDNTPPAITTEIGTGNPVRIVVRVTDAHSPIQKVEYSVDAGGWQAIPPADGLADSLTERYEITLPAGTSPGRVVIRATDALQNVVSAPVGR